MQVLIILLLVGFIRPGALQGPVDWALYHRTEEILDYCRQIAIQKPSLASFEEIPDPDSQFRLPVFTLTDNSATVDTKPVILIVSGEHARELITSEIIYWLSGLLTDDAKWEEASKWKALKDVENVAVSKGWADTNMRLWARTILQKAVIKIVPVLNIAGRKAVEGGDLCLRKTISGVDLNRNWPYAWTQTESSSDEFGGQQPFSEPESRIIKLLAQAQNPHAFVNLHSGEWAMYVPWDSKTERAPDLPDDSEMLLETMNEFCQCMNGPAGKVAGYLALGTSMDWMYAEHHVPYPLTFEVFGPKDLGKLSAGGHPRLLLQNLESDLTVSLNSSSSENVSQTSETRTENNDSSISQDQATSTALNCFPSFNPTTSEEYQSVVASWIGALMALGRHITSLPLQNLASFHAEQLQQPELPIDKNGMGADTASEIGKIRRQDPLPKIIEDVQSGASKSFDQKGREDLEKQAGKGLRKKTIENYARNAQETSLSKSQDRDVLHYTFVASFSRILLGIFVIVGISLIAFSKYSKRQGHRSVKGKE